MECTIEPVGDIEGGILAASWSNDQEMFVVLTCVNSLVLLNSSFEVLNEGVLEDLLPNTTPSDVFISWRSDGEFFCINYPNNTNAQIIRVFSKELHSVSTS